MQRRPRRTRRAAFSINRMIPNALTVLALCAGLTAVRYGLAERWEPAVAAIVIAGILDGLDGRIARMLRSASKFGAELDSLSDVVAFGVAPAFLLYLWTMQDAGNPGWILVLLFAVCCGLRLARFNTRIDEPDPPWAQNFFSGVPAPAAAGLVLLPMMLSFNFDWTWLRSPFLNGAVLISVAALMVSRVPTWSFKTTRLPARYVLPFLLFVGLIGALVTSNPWMTVVILVFLYIFTFPLSIRAWARLRREIRALGREVPGEAATPDEAGGEATGGEATGTDDGETPDSEPPTGDRAD